MSGESEETDERGSLFSPRLIIRPWRPQDAAVMTALSAGGASGREADERADARGWIARARMSEDASTFVLVERATMAAVGAAGVAPSPDQLSRRELGIWIAEPSCGRGLATEALHSLIDHAFAAGAHDQLWGVCRVTNSRARRVIEKCGFQYRENGMARSVALRGAVPVERFVLERRNWLSLKAWGAAATVKRAENGFAA